MILLWLTETPCIKILVHSVTLGVKCLLSIFSLAISVLEYITQPIMLFHVSVHSSAFCLRHRERDPISVAFFDRVTLFSDFNHLFELLDQVLLLIAVVPFIYWNYAPKTF